MRGAEGPAFFSVGPKKIGDFLPLWEGAGRGGGDMEGNTAKEMEKE